VLAAVECDTAGLALATEAYLNFNLKKMTAELALFSNYLITFNLAVLDKPLL